MDIPDDVQMERVADAWRITTPEGVFYARGSPDGTFRFTAEADERASAHAVTGFSWQPLTARDEQEAGALWLAFRDWALDREHPFGERPKEDEVM